MITIVSIDKVDIKFLVDNFKTVVFQRQHRLKKLKEIVDGKTEFLYIHIGTKIAYNQLFVNWIKDNRKDIDDLVFVYYKTKYKELLFPNSIKIKNFQEFSSIDEFKTIIGLKPMKNKPVVRENNLDYKEKKEKVNDSKDDISDIILYLEKALCIIKSMKKSKNRRILKIDNSYIIKEGDKIIKEIPINNNKKESFNKAKSYL